MTPLAPVAPKAMPAPPAEPGPSGQRFHEVLSRPTVGAVNRADRGVAGPGAEALVRLDAGRKRLDQILAQARAGRTFRPRELLALQAEVYRISEEFAVVSKVVEQAVAGAKRVWNLQV